MEFKKQDLINVTDGCDVGGLKFIEQTQWRDEGRYQYQETVFQYKDKFYQIKIGRSGSHYSEWYYDCEDWYDEVECDEVFKKEIVTYKWVAKNEI